MWPAPEETADVFYPRNALRRIRVATNGNGKCIERFITDYVRLEELLLPSYFEYHTSMNPYDGCRLFLIILLK